MYNYKTLKKKIIENFNNQGQEKTSVSWYQKHDP